MCFNAGRALCRTVIMANDGYLMLKLNIIQTIYTISSVDHLMSYAYHRHGI